jgi:ubiquinol-cytochrome c reductase cytochrome b subunit
VARLLRAVWSWLDDRAGVNRLWRGFADEPIPGGARWAYVFGSALTIVFALQALSGVMLAFYYSPSSTDAWASVYFIQREVTGGWILRGLHHWGSSAMIVLVVAHAVQTFLFGAHKKPRELNWIIGVLMALLVLAFGLTGYLLPWDQKGYWATRVATGIAGSLPVVGAALERLAVGGSDYGNLTLTRFFAIHVFVLPFLLVTLLGAHIYLFRRHGTTPPPGLGKTSLARVELFVPRQLALDAWAGLAVVAILAAVVWATGGADLDAPADPASNYLARPEWYFLALFQLLKYFEGPLQLIGTVVLPGLATTIALVLPFLDRGPERRAAGGVVGPFVAFMAPAVLAIAVNLAGIGSAGPRDPVRLVWAVALPCAAIFAVVALGFAKRPEPDSGPQAAVGKRGRLTLLVLFGLGAVVAFTLLGAHEDAVDPSVAKAAAAARARADKALELAAAGVPPGGGEALWASDPFSDGERVFQESCAVCHTLNGAGEHKGPALTGWARRAWLVAVIRTPDDPRLFGPTKKLKAMPPYDKPGEAEALAEFLLAEGGEKAVDAALVEKGRKLFADDTCKDCHLYGGEGRDLGTPGPELKAYATKEWLEGFITNPGAEKYFGPLNEMPVFAEKLTKLEIEHVAAYLMMARGESMEPPAAAPAPAPAPAPATAAATP